MKHESGHADTLTVGADPGWSVTDPPQIFLKTGLTYHKATGATQAIGFLFLAAMALIFTNLFSPVTRPFSFIFVHIRNSFFSHCL